MITKLYKRFSLTAVALITVLSMGALKGYAEDSSGLPEEAAAEQPADTAAAAASTDAAQVADTATIPADDEVVKPEGKAVIHEEPAKPKTAEDEISKAKHVMTTNEEDENATISKAKKRAPIKASQKYRTRAEAFIASPEWEFDGFIAGAQDQSIKSMYTTNDLVYLNLGSQQGLSTGDYVGVYRRGQRIRDPQSRQMLGYEVRKVAVAEITDRVDEQTSSARVIKVFEPAEVGDLIRLED